VTRPPLAVVTGASTGIGRALTEQLVGRGLDVVAVADDMDAVASLGPGVAALRTDLATPEGNDTLLARVDADGRVPSVVALNAGVGVGGPFLERDVEQQLRLVRLNVESVVRLAHVLGRAMAGEGHGGLLLTSSIAARMPGPYNATYAASKAFVQSFAHALHRELRPRGVVVTSLLPGPTDTAFFGRAGLEDSRIGRGRKDDPADVARAGLEAMMAGDPQVVAGSWRNALQDAVSGLLPDRAKAALHERLNR
jgi:short-subunit dehydrogenase